MNDEKRHIANILNRFFNGESTLAEEEELGRYFATHDVDEDWKAYKQMFAYFDGGMKDEKPAATVVKVRRVKWWRYAAAAAVVALMASVALYVMQPADMGSDTGERAVVVADASKPASAAPADTVCNIAEAAPTADAKALVKTHQRRPIKTVSSQCKLDVDSAAINQIIAANLLAEQKVDEESALFEEQMIAAQKTIDDELMLLCAANSTMVQVVTMP